MKKEGRMIVGGFLAVILLGISGSDNQRQPPIELKGTEWIGSLNLTREGVAGQGSRLEERGWGFNPYGAPINPGQRPPATKPLNPNQSAGGSIGSVFGAGSPQAPQGQQLQQLQQLQRMQPVQPSPSFGGQGSSVGGAGLPMPNRAVLLPSERQRLNSNNTAGQGNAANSLGNTQGCGQVDAFPAQELEVKYVEDPVFYDNSKDIHTLKRVQQNYHSVGANTLTFGLTQTKFATKVDINIKPIGENCSLVNVVFRTSLSPINVSIASDLLNNQCAYDAVKMHELEHVRVHREFAKFSNEFLKKTLENQYRGKVFTGSPQAIAPQIQEQLKAIQKQAFAVYDKQDPYQQAVDSPYTKDKQLFNQCMNFASPRMKFGE